MELVTTLSLINLIMLAIALLFFVAVFFDFSKLFKIQDFGYKTRVSLLLLLALTLAVFYRESLLTSSIYSVTILAYVAIVIFTPRHYFFWATLILLLCALVFIIIDLGTLAEFCGNFIFVLLVSGFVHDVIWPLLTEEKEFHENH
jgi:uncharacterized membrane protein